MDKKKLESFKKRLETRQQELRRTVTRTQQDGRSADEDTARLVFARSADSPGDMNALMRSACELLDGRGGGKPDMAQGGGRNVEKLGMAIDAAGEAYSKQA